MQPFVLFMRFQRQCVERRGLVTVQSQIDQSVFRCFGSVEEFQIIFHLVFLIWRIQFIFNNQPCTCFDQHIHVTSVMQDWVRRCLSLQRSIRRQLRGRIEFKMLEKKSQKQVALTVAFSRIEQPLQDIGQFILIWLEQLYHVKAGRALPVMVSLLRLNFTFYLREKLLHFGYAHQRA